MDFLSENGLLIFKALKKHCQERLKMMEVDDYELKMLANSFDIYSSTAGYCLANGHTHEMETKTGTYPMVRPEYTIMKNEYANILKHSAKFGLNPGDRAKFFKTLDEGKKQKGFNLGSKPDMKAA